ncbi:MAG: hypothetical protein J0L83_02980 [Chitinophagales bacterium]|mgnify:FL=1|jgi:hypothetical protein|nr:hypothetical protein [Chitinophagales bacterium]
MRILLHLLLYTFTFQSFSQVNDTDAFFEGRHDKKIFKANRIQQIKAIVTVGNFKPSTFIYEFDKKGYLLKQSVFDRNGKIINEYIFKNNKYGDQLKRINISYSIQRTDTTLFDKKYKRKLLIQESVIGGSGKTVHFYHNKKKTESITYYSNDTSSSDKLHTSYIYDTKNRLINISERIFPLLSTEPILIRTTTYTYDSLNMVTHANKLGGATYQYSYKENGLLESKTEIISGDYNNILVVEQYSYTFWKL